MAGDKKPKLDNSVRIYKYGDLNPVFDNRVQEVHDDPLDDMMGAVRQVVRKSYTPDARQGTGPYRGVVLRKNENISSGSTTPADTWLANVFAFGSSAWTRLFGDSLDQMPYELESYQVYIPELMTNLPQIKKYVPTGVPDPEHTKIDLYPAFIAKDSNVPSAMEGDIVWVDYGDRINLLDPTYLGPVFPLPIPDEASGGDQTGAREAMDGACGSPPQPPPTGKDLLSWNKYTTPTGELLSTDLQRIKPSPNVADNLKADIKEYRETFKNAKPSKLYPGILQGNFMDVIQSFPKTGCRPGDDAYLCMYHLQEFVHSDANSQFISKGVHKPGGSHAEGYAIDIPAWTRDKTGTSDIIAKFWEDKGYAVIWRARGHYDHVHVGWGPSEQRRGGRGQRIIKDPDNLEEGQVPYGSPDGKSCPEGETRYAGSPPGAATVSKPKIQSVRVKYDKLRYGKAAGEGYSSDFMRGDVAKDIINIKDIVNNLGGILATSGSTRKLNDYDPKNKNRSLTSFHYTNMALDLCVAAGSIQFSGSRSNPRVTEYVITKSTERNSSGRYYFDIWARSDKPNAEYKGYKVQRIKLDALTCPRRHFGRAKTVPVTGYYINLWQIFKDHGFKRIAGRSKWYMNCNSKNPAPAAEWWHMQSHKGLVEGQTTWEAALKKTHPDKEVEKSPVYKHRNKVFRGKGFSRS